MRIPRIFTDQAIAPGTLELEPDPSRHIARALRLREGAPLVLFNGQGGEYRATVMRVGKKTVDVEVGDYQPVSSESPLGVHLGIALSRGERFDWVVQKATELGVASIAPLFTEHTSVKLSGDRVGKKLAHWRQIAISACEQCGRNTIPGIHIPVTLSHWLAEAGSPVRWVLHTSSDAVKAAMTDMPAPSSIDLLVGPEGGFSDTEIEAAVAAGFSALQLGPRILRTETAPVVALAIVQSRWGDLAPR